MKTSTLTFLIMLVFACASSLVSCRKEPIAAQQPTVSPLQQARREIEASFTAQHLDQKLVEQLKNAAELHWQPNWPAITQQKVNDSVNFFYIPLHPASKTPESDKLKSNNRLAASKHYLVVKQIVAGPKNSFEFFSARYIFQLQPGARVDPTQRANPFNSFNGVVLMQGLLNGERRRLVYVNGVVAPTSVKPQTSATKSGARVNSMSCDNYWTCLWKCDNMGHEVYATTSGLNDCLEPSVAVNGMWQQIQWTIEPYCYDDGTNSPPLPGSYPGGTVGSDSGNGGGESTGADTPLEAVVESNNRVSLYPPCPGLTDAWLPLLNFQAPSAVLDRFNSLTNQQLQQIKLLSPSYSSVDPMWQIQALQNAGGIAINLDYFSVSMTQFPVINGRQLSAMEFLEYMRLNLNNFVGAGQPTFEPSPILSGEASRWQNHTIGTIMSISILPDNGSVVLSYYNQYAPYGGSWTFSTIYDPYNGTHPVSGNRTFGVSTSTGFAYTDLWGMYHNNPTTYTFYIQGADRIFSRPGELFGSLLNLSKDPAQAKQFEKGDQLWNGLMSNLASFVNVHGGAASVDPSVANRPNWTDVNTALTNHRPLNSVPCN